VTASAVVLMLSAVVPTNLMAAEREAPTTMRAATIDWLSTLWHELAALFAAGTTPPTSGSGGGPSTQGSCAVDPNGGCYGG
jgi:hypothetical protein